MKVLSSKESKKKMNINLSSAFLLIISGAVSSALLSTGYFLASFVSIGLTAVCFFYLDRKEKKSQALLQDKPVY